MCDMLKMVDFCSLLLDILRWDEIGHIKFCLFNDTLREDPRVTI